MVHSGFVPGSGLFATLGMGWRPVILRRRCHRRVTIWKDSTCGVARFPRGTAFLKSHGTCNVRGDPGTRMGRFGDDREGPVDLTLNLTAPMKRLPLVTRSNGAT